MRFDTAADMEMRLAAFAWLESQVKQHGRSLPRRPTLEQGFLFVPGIDQVADPPPTYGGIALPDNTQRVSMMAQHGIFTPKQCNYPLTITSTGTQYEDPYDSQSGVLRYSYSTARTMGERGNKGLHELMDRKLPLVYFYCLRPGDYLPLWPAWVVFDDPVRREFGIVVGEDGDVTGEGAGPVAPPLRYRDRIMRQRLHQPVFRHMVLTAYGGRCALCRLGHAPLLDAAHIKPDSEGGPAATSNGMAMCRLHHGAYDANLLGINPQGRIAIPQQIMDEEDGPTLKHSLVGLNGETISTPRRKSDRPERAFLALRWDRFQSANR